MKRRLIALMLVISLVASLSVTAFAGIEGKEKIVYVSIGDSMTNGYGIEGYDGESGIMNYGNQVYANQFAAWLAGMATNEDGSYTIEDDQTVFTGANGTVDHRQLAMSGMRSEDLAWLLQLDHTKLTDEQFKNIAQFRYAVAADGKPWQSALADSYNYCKSCGKQHIHGWQHEWGNGREYWYSYDVVHKKAETGLGFASGDWRTWTDLVNPSYRLADGVVKVLSMYGKEGFGFSTDITLAQNVQQLATAKLSNSDWLGDNQWSSSNIDALFNGAEGQWLEFAAEFYQESIADADVITLALGNTNFGTFMFDTIKELFLSSNVCEFASRYHIDEVYLMAERAGIDDELMAMIKDLINSEIDPMMKEQFESIANEVVPDVVGSFTVDPYQILERNKEGQITKGALIKYIIEYCVLSYIVGYVASVERIVELNPDVEVIQIALMNAYKTEDSEPGSFADIIDMLYGPMNAFVAMMPEYLAGKNPDKYDEATFYYADTGIVETLSAVYGDDYYTYDNKAITYDEYLELLAENAKDDTAFDESVLVQNTSTVRSRFHKWIAGADGCRHDCGGGGHLNYGVHAYITDCYLCMEIYHNPNDVSYGWGKFEYAELLKYIVGPMECPYPDDTISPTQADKDKYNSGWDFNKFFDEYRMVMVTEADVRKYEKMTAAEKNAMLLSGNTFETYTTQKGRTVPYQFNGSNGHPAGKTAAVREADWAFSCAMYLALEEATILAGTQGFTLSDLTSVQGMTPATFKGVAEQFAKEMDQPVFGTGSELASPDADAIRVGFRNALLNDGPTVTMLCLANRMQIGSGIGGHPSEGGHDTMAAAIIRDYEAKNTGEEVTKNFLLSYLTENYPNLMDKLTGAEGAGDMDDLAIIIQMLKMSDNAALEGVDLDELEAEIRDTLRAYEKAHTAEEAEEAQAAADTLYLKLYALAAAVTGTEYVADEDSFYVSLGDSNVNGYGLPGYEENTNFGVGQIVDGAAPVELAKELYDEDWENRFCQYAQGALRSEDMLSILTGKVVNEDSYWKTEVSDRLLVPGDIEATNKAYIEALQKADLISVAVGGGNITTFVGRQVDLVLAGNEPIPMDWAVIGYEDEALVELDKMLDTMVPLMDAMGMMDQYLPEGVTLEKCGAAKFGRTLLESVLYGYASYNYYYPMVLDTLRAINPEAQLLILGMFNPVDDWNTTFGDKFINIGGITDNLMESANLQNLAFALQTPNTTFVDLSDNITFLDEDVAAGKKKPTFEVYYESILKGNGKEVHASANGHAYMYEQMLAALSGEGYDEELKDLGELVYEALCDDYLTTREKLNILGEAYATAKHEGVLKQNREIAVAEEIYEYLDDAGYIGDDQILEIIKYVLGCALDGEISKLALADYIIEVLGGNEDLTDADRVAMIGNIYTILEDAGYLADYEADLSLLEDLHAELKDYLTDTQSVAIVEAIYDALTDDGQMSDEEKIAIAQFVYELVLVDGKLSYEDRVDAIIGVYGVLKAEGYLAGYEKELAMVEELVAHEAMKKVPAEQAFAIVDYIYDAVCDGDVDTREMLGYIYFDVLSVNPADEVISLLGEVESNLTAADKLAIVEAVYEIMDKHYDLKSTSNLRAIKDLYDVLTDDEGGEQLVSDELALSIIDLTVEALVENETLGEEEITEVAAEIADKLLGEDSELSREAKAAVLREVTNALKSTDLGETEIGGVVIPALDVIDELRTELEAAGHLNAAQAGEIIEIVYSFVKENDTLTEKQKARMADKVYTVLLNREDLTAEDKIDIITIIYTVLDEHDYVDANVTIAYMKAYAAAKEKGYIDDAALALDAVKGIVELAKDYVDMYPGSEELKALLLEELDNTEETLDALIGLLDNEVLDEAAWAELKALEDELNKHIETIAELAEAMGVELDDCIADLEDAAKVYGNMIAEVAEAAYDYAVESIEGFADDYAEWVESVGDEIDEVNPVLGDAVRKFLTEVPADSLSILYAYGDEAVAKLVSEAVKAYGDMKTVIADLAYVLNTYGEEIYEAVKGNDEIEELIEDIQDQLAEVKELVEWINDHPFEGAYNASVADKEAALQAAYDQLVYLYNRLYDVAMSVIADVDEDAAEALEAALDAMSEILSIAGESAEGYLGWLADHGEAMGCALLTALLDNIEELLTTACPIVDELIWALLAQVDQAILEFLPVADQWMYDWLYNNPDKVIAFFTEYGEEIGELTEEYGKYVAGILGYIAYTYGPEVLEYVMENPEEALEQFVAWYEKYGYRVWPMIDVYLEELGVYDAIEEGAEAVIEKIEEALEELGVQLESEIRDLIDEKLDDATHGEYTVTADSYYVAIDEMYGEDEEGYADKLAEHLGIAYNEINELDEDEIAKADLITVRYNNEPMIGVMIEDAKDYKTAEAKDWSVYVGEVGAEYVQQALVEVKAMLAEQDLGTMSDMALVAVESYAYEYVGHMINYIQDLETISEINPDALVISVGMNNALSDVVLTLDEEEIALGEYIQYVVDAANLEAFVYVLVTGNAIYVDAPAVETEFDAEESADVMDFILNLIDEESREVLLANDDGHEYIKEQILGALTITYEGLLGDANSDGIVDYVDAIYVLEYDAKLRTADELAYGLCDVNGDGEVDYVDAIFILEYDAKLITKFPAAV